jgi:hypothetical protein
MKIWLLHQSELFKQHDLETAIERADFLAIRAYEAQVFVERDDKSLHAYYTSRGVRGKPLPHMEEQPMLQKTFAKCERCGFDSRMHDPSTWRCPDDRGELQTGYAGPLPPGVGGAL